MFRILMVFVTLVMVPGISVAQITITKPALAGPVRLVCLNPDQLVGMVKAITRQQILGITYVARDGQIHRGCDDVQLPVGTVPLHERWIQTRDGWWVIGQTLQYPNGFIVVSVDPLQATYVQRPIQFRRYYGQGVDYFVPVVPRHRPSERKRNRHRDNRLEVDDIQHLLKKRAEEERRRLKRQ